MFMNVDSLPTFSIKSLAGFGAQTNHSLLLDHLNYGSSSSSLPIPYPSFYSDTVHSKEGSNLTAHHKTDLSG